MTRIRWIAAGRVLAATGGIALVLAAVSCGDTDCTSVGTCTSAEESDGGSPDGGELPAATSFPMTATAPPTVLAGTTAEVDVAFVRDGVRPVVGAVRVALAPQDGITAEPIVVAPQESSGKLVVIFAKARRHGATKLVMHASAEGAESTAEAATLVRGAPGSLDTSFGDNGALTLAAAGSETTGAAMQADGKIVLGGRLGEQIVVARLLDDGRLDPAFGSGGTVSFPMPGGGSLASTNDVVVDPQGAIVIGFEREFSGSPETYVLRLTETGALDTSFGTANGIADVRVPSFSTLALNAQGELFAGGKPPTGGGNYVVKHLRSGARDDQWGQTGSVTLTGPGSPGTCVGAAGANCRTRAIAVEPDGKLYVCSPRNDGSAVCHIDVNGAPIAPSWNTSLTLDACGGLALESAAPGHVFVAGDSMGYLSVMRLLPDGTFSIPWGNASNMFRAPAETGLKFGRRIANVDNRIVVGAVATIGGESHLAVVRLTSFGVLDTSFAEIGYVSLKVGGKPSTTKAMAIDSLGRVIVAGTNGSTIAARFWL